MIARALVRLWILVRFKLNLPGAGMLLRLFVPLVPALRAYPLEVPGVGVAPLDFRDAAAYNMVKLFALNDRGNDAALIEMLTLALKPSAVFWDIGANAGCISGYFAHPRFKLGNIHAFEPNPEALKTLQPLFKDHPRVVVHPFGLGLTDSTLEMTYTSSLGGSVVLKNEGGKQISISIRNADTARRELKLPLPDVIKIDVEGYEPEVFAGLTETIAQSRPTIFFEHLWLTDEKINQLRPANYLIFFLWDNGTISTDFTTRLQGHDAILLPAEKKTWPPV